MKRFPLYASFAVFLFVPAATHGQAVARLNRSMPATADAKTVEARAVAALNRLQRQVIVYRSLGEFEASGRLSHVSLESFEQELLGVISEVQPILSRIPASKFKIELTNALASYRDGAYWWRKIDQPRVVHVSALNYNEQNRTPAEAVFRSNIPYTVAIHWRQAARYLNRAEALIDEQGK
jgi:acyl transferase domain-containing protein